MHRDTRCHPRLARPTAAVLRAWQEISTLLDTPPANSSSDELLALRERCRVEAEAVESRQGRLPLAPP